MRPALALLVLATACGRIGFDPARIGDDGGDAAASDGLPPADTAPPALACAETRSAGTATITGKALEAVLTARGLAALWIDDAGALRGITWSTDAAGGVVPGAPTTIAAGPFQQLWAAANGDEILAVADAGPDLIGHFLKGDLTPLRPTITAGSGPIFGRAPIAPRRGGPGFVAVASDAGETAIHEIDGGNQPVPHPIAALALHGAPSIAADATGYAVITEYADQYGPGCWYSRVDEAFALGSGPGYVESTQQADCDSPIVAASAGPMGAGIIWMDRDPINVYVEFRGTAGGGNQANLGTETSPGQPNVTATSAGFVATFRSAAGLHAFDKAGSRKLSATTGLADLVTWGDVALVVWADAAGAPQLTRLCP